MTEHTDRTDRTDRTDPISRSLGHLELPLMLELHYSPDIGMLTLRPLHHTRPCVTFTQAAAEYCGGAVEHDDDGYVVRCADELMFVDTARAMLLVLHGA